MKIKLAVSFILLISLIAFYEYYQNKYNINKSVETSKDITFLIKRDFESIRKSIVEGKFEEEILKINNAVVIEKNWTDKMLHLERPFRLKRWEFSGTMFAKIKINNEDIGKENIDMKHSVEISNSDIRIVASLENPIKKIGLATLEQKIKLNKKEKETLADVSVSMKIERLIPGFMEKYAKEELDKTAENYLKKIEEAINNLPEPKPGISIPLKSRK